MSCDSAKKRAVEKRSPECSCRSTGVCPGYGSSRVCPPLLVLAVLSAAQQMTRAEVAR